MLLAVRRRLPYWATKVLLCGGLLWSLVAYNLLDNLRTSIPLVAAVEGDADKLDLETSAPPTSEECWAYTHLQKAGGTTIKNLLFDFWGSKSTTYDSYQWKKGQGYADSAAASLTSPTGFNAVAGGYPEALRNTPALQDDGAGKDSSCRWFTVFRHPVSRLVSAFYYCRQDPSDQLCASDIVSSRDVDLETFARHWGNYAVRQFALGLVSPDEVRDYLLAPPVGGRESLTEDEVERMPGWYMLKLFLHDRSQPAELREEGFDGFGEGQVPDADGDEAALRDLLVPVQDLLRDRYAAVGILEEWGATLSLFNAALGLPGMDWHERFESTGKLNVDVIFEGQKLEALEKAMTDAEIKRHLWLDLLLYEHALDVFHRQRQLYGID